MELSVEFDVPQTPLFAGDVQQVVGDESRAAMNAAVLVVQGQILPRVPVDRGILRQGVQTSVTGNAVDLVGRVFDPVAYAVPVELGSQPHWPPIEPLVGWVRRRLGIGDERQARSVAFLVARAISRRGTKAREFFKAGWQASKGKVDTIFERANARIAARLLGSP